MQNIKTHHTTAHPGLPQDLLGQLPRVAHHHGAEAFGAGPPQAVEEGEEEGGGLSWGGGGIVTRIFSQIDAIVAETVAIMDICRSLYESNSA